MLLINCPWCGPRDETEFHYGSEAHIGYPEKPEELTDKQWAEYIFYRNNPKGWFAERWVHNVGGLLNVGFITLAVDVGSIFGETLLIMNLVQVINLLPSNQVGLNEYCSIYF